VTIGPELTTDIYNALPANVNTINTTFEALYMLAVFGCLATFLISEYMELSNTS
jgi:hypothetical protein